MRKIKFRGKVKMSIEKLNDLGIPHENGWVYGAYVPNGDYPWIISHDVADVCEDYFHPHWWCPVDPATVGQCTGLKDKNGMEIYEGDILTADRYPFTDNNEPNYNAIVFWEEECALFAIELRCVNSSKRGISNGVTEGLTSRDDSAHFEVIGNRWDNPELLEVKP